MHIIGFGRRARETYPVAPSASGGGTDPLWTVYAPTLDNANHDASIGNGELTGTFIKDGKTCRIQLALTWGTTSSAGTASILVPVPPGVTVDFSRMMTVAALGGAPATPVVATGLINGSPIAISADFARIGGNYITSAPINTLQAGSVVFLSAEFPCL